MQARGFSLIEMVVAIGICSILLAIATLSFNEYARRHRSEAQTRLIFTELQKARADALFQRRAVRVKFHANRFEVYSSVVDEDADPVATHPLGYPIVFNKESLYFDEKGIASVMGCSICLDAGYGAGAVDSVVISKIRVSIGKKGEGDDCSAPNIRIQ